ncbi:hypothetical protein [Streptomyces sp. NPDC005732]|uniref:hypothetical protein n=1 Tax=Streptomyces sp. NPDC005732 TaxID=3157057 RepID=UPI00340EEB04
MSPSPADLARRAPSVTPASTQTAAEAAIAPGRLVEPERFKPMYHWGLLISDMLPESRLLGYTLLWYAHHTTGRISPARQPNRAKLVQQTGLSAARVGVHIETLRQRGWLHLATVPEGPRAGLPRYDLTIPSLYLERIRAARAERDRLNIR